MSEPLGSIIEGYVIMAAGQDGIEEQRINIGLEIPAVHLDGELVPQNQGDSKRVMLIVILPVPFSGEDDLLQTDEVLIRNRQRHVGDHLDALRHKLLTPGTPDLFAIELFVAAYHLMDCRQGFALAEKAGISHQLPGAAAVILAVSEMVQQVQHTEVEQGNRMGRRTAQRWEHHQGEAQRNQDYGGHQNLLKSIIASARRPITRNTPDTIATLTKTDSRYGISSDRLSGGIISIQTTVKNSETTSAMRILLSISWRRPL